MKKIILASTSPRRKEILDRIGLRYEIYASNYEEDMGLDLPPLELVKFLSMEKAKPVAKMHPDAIVIGADTIVVCGGEIFGKPKTPERAKEMLGKMSGVGHTVITGFSIIHNATANIVSRAVETKVFFKKLSAEEIDAYVATGEPLDRAGAYAIQDRSGIFVEKIEGDYFNIVGLPICALSEELQKLGVVMM